MPKEMPLTVRQNINAADTAPAWDSVDLDQMRSQVGALRFMYPMSDIRLAQFLMEEAMALEAVVQTPSEGIRDALIAHQANLAMLASAVSRKPRGKPEI